MMAAGGIFTPASATTSGWEGLRTKFDDWPVQKKKDWITGTGFDYGGASAGKPTIKHTPSSWFDDGFQEKLKEQLADAGKDYDAADQPFKSLSPVSVPGARHQPAQMPSMLTTRGIPTGGSYNPYLGDPAKRKPRPR